MKQLKLRIENEELKIKNLRNLPFFILRFSFLIFVLSGCATIYNPATGKEETVIVATPDEIAIGQKMAYQIERRFKADPDPLAQARIRAIGNDLANVSDRKDAPYYFKVLKGDEINAFATPGGFVYVFRGLIDKTESDAELASVIAHEIGHVAARHAAKKMELEMGYNIVMSIAFGSQSKPELERYVNIGFNLIALGYSREDEMFADKLGIRYLIRAGYSPYGAVSFMEKMERMEKEEGATPIYFLRSHPYMSQRIEEARKEIPRELAREELAKQGIGSAIKNVSGQ